MNTKFMLSGMLTLSMITASTTASARKLSPSAPSLILDEKSIWKMAKESSPVLEGIQAQNQLAKLEKSSLDAQYETRLSGSWNYAESREDGLADFIPVYSPERSAAIGLSKKLPVGMNIAVQGFSNQINADLGSFGVIDRATRTGTTVNLEVDLFKNFFGRFDRFALLEKQSAAEKAELQAKLSEKEVEMDLRKLYWSMVANQLKKLVPAVVDKNFSVNPNGIDSAVRGVLACVKAITVDPSGNPDYSSYYSVIDLTKKQYEGERRQAETTGDIDVKLTTGLRWSGVETGFDESLNEFNDNARDGYSVGLQVSIPLEGDIRDAELAQKRLVETKYNSEIRNLQLQVQETHKQVAKSLVLLQDAAVALNANVETLDQSLKSTKRKYRQARVSINELIREQDQLFSSQLNEIETKLAVIHALYDYFKVFNTHPCPMNEI